VKSRAEVINLFEPAVGHAEVAAVDGVFASGWLGAGCLVGEFRQAFASQLGCNAGDLVAVTSCTEGLFQAMDALELGPDDEVVLPAISFVGAAHAVRSTGARVSLCDVDPLTLNPTVEHMAAAVTHATRCVVVLHYGGHAGDVVDIAELARRHSLSLVEDAACGLGTTVDGQACGTFGDIGVWSFDAMKVVTTGDGGMVWTRRPEVAERIRRAVSLGGGPPGFARRSGSSRWWEVDAAAPGRRAGMNDVCAAIGLVQLGRLNTFLERRHEIVAAYQQGLADVPWLRVRGQPEPGSAPIFSWIQTAAGTRDRLATHLLERGIYTSFRYWPLHRIPLYACDGHFPGADEAARTTLLLPLHQGLSDEDVARVIETVRAFESSGLQ
jgi:aminotransferase